MEIQRSFKYRVFYYSTFILLMVIVSCQDKSKPDGLDRNQKAELQRSKDRTIEHINLLNKPAVIYRSDDLGQSWSPFANGIPEDATLSGIKQHDSKFYITTDYHGVFMKANSKASWISLNDGSLNNLDINCIEAGANKLVIGTLRNGVLFTTDSGKTWKQATRNIEQPIRAFLKFDNKLYAGTDAGIFESLDMGETWTHKFGRMQILGFTTLNGKCYAATQNGALMYNGNPQEWKYIYKGDALHDIGNDGIYIYAMTIGQQLLKTKDDGASWQNAQNGITQPANFYTNEIQAIGNDVFSAQWIGVYHSSDNGEHWSLLSGLPDSTAFSTLAITDLGIIAGISIR